MAEGLHRGQLSTTMRRLGTLAALAGLLPAQEVGRVVVDVVDVRGRSVGNPAVEVQAPGRDAAAAVRDDDGSFVRDGVPFGRSIVTARADGYFPGRAVARLGSRRAECRVRLELFAAAPITGSVRAEDGSPVAGALVLFTAEGKVLVGGPEVSTRTAADGRYRLEVVPLGPVALTVIASGHQVGTDELALEAAAVRDFRLPSGPVASYRITIADASVAQWDGMQIQLRMRTHSNYRPWELGELWAHTREGETVVYAGLPVDLRIDEIVVTVPDAETDPRRLEVHEGPGTQSVATKVVPSPHAWTTPTLLRGVVRDPAGKPLAGLRICQMLPARPPDLAVTGADGSFALATLVSRSGFFSLFVDQDDYVIHREDRNSYHYVIHAGSYFERQEHKGELAIVADRAASARGRVVDASGAAVADAEVQLLANQYQRRKDIAGTIPDTQFAVARTAADGSFAMRRLDGHLGLDLWLRVTSPRGMYSAGPLQIAPGAELLLGTLEFPTPAPGEQVQPAAVALPAPATVEGRIVDGAGRPRAGIEVHLFREHTGPALQDSWTGYTDQDGRYLLSGLPAGDYRVKIATPYGMHAEWPDYGRVTVRAGERAEVRPGADSIARSPLVLAAALGALVALVVFWQRRRRARRSRDDPGAEGVG